MARPGASADKPDRPAGAEVTPLRPRARCPICGRPAERTFSPFCSRRCAEIDLNRWLSGSYAIPGRPVDEESESPPGKDEGDGGE